MLETYGFENIFLKLIHSYPLERYNFRYSILGLLLFNIFLCDFFILMRNIGFSIYGDDHTPYIISNDLDKEVSTLEDNAANILKWFSDNQMKPNPKKCHLLTNKVCRKKKKYCQQHFRQQ